MIRESVSMLRYSYIACLVYYFSEATLEHLFFMTNCSFTDLEDITLYSSTLLNDLLEGLLLAFS